MAQGWLSDLIDWANPQNTSVFDSPYQRLLRNAAGILLQKPKQQPPIPYGMGGEPPPSRDIELQGGQGPYDTAGALSKAYGIGPTPSSYERLGRNSISGMQMNPEEEQSMFDLTPVAHSVSMYATPQIRKLGTRLFINKVNNLFDAGHIPQEWKDALLKFAGDYPRVASHINPDIMNQADRLAGVDPYATGAFTEALPGQVTSRRRLVITPGGVDYINDMRTGGISNPVSRAAGVTLDPKPFSQGLAEHEGTHIAQMLGNKDYNILSNRMRRMLQYEYKPNELSALWRQLQTTSDVPRDERVTSNMIQRLREMTSDVLSHPLANRNQLQAARDIIDILDRRAATPMKAPGTITRQLPQGVTAKPLEETIAEEKAAKKLRVP